MLALCREIASSAEKILAELGEAGKEKLGKNAAGHRSIRADIEIEKAVISKLRGKVKTLISEEAGEIALDGNEGIAVCDPLDGSHNYSHSIPIYCIALCFSKTRAYKDINFAYVRDLASKNEFWADEKNAYQNGRQIFSSKKTEISKCIIEIDENKSGNWKRFGRLLPSVQDYRRGGANALDLCYLANGGLDAFIDLRNTLSIVHVAGIFIAEKAGAHITDSDCKRLAPELKINSPLSFIGAGNRQLHAKIAGLID